MIHQREALTAPDDTLGSAGYNNLTSGSEQLFQRVVWVAIHSGIVQQVTIADDANPGSLRQVIADAPSGSLITFANALAGQTITLTSGRFRSNASKSLHIDASSLPGGITLDDNANDRHFNFSSGTTNTLSSLVLTNGSRLSGGSIANYGTLTLHNSIVAGNQAIIARLNTNGSSTGTNNLTSGDPLLAPLGDYGGRTLTMPPLPGSPAIEGGVLLGSTPLTDQRGNARPSGPLPDLGAVEAGSLQFETRADTFELVPEAVLKAEDFTETIEVPMLSDASRFWRVGKQ